MKTFRDLSIGDFFRLNGNLYGKKSARTGYLIAERRTFYIGQYELVEVGPQILTSR